jgi:hypothetical protein
MGALEAWETLPIILAFVLVLTLWYGKSSAGLLFSPRSMEYYSWTNTGVPKPEMWEVDDQMLSVQTSHGTNCLCMR